MMKRILHYFVLAASVAVMVCSCYGDSTPETPVIPPTPPFTEEEGKFVRVIESDPAGKWVTIQYTGMGADGTIKNLSELIMVPQSSPELLAIGCHITITSDAQRPTNYKNLSVMTDVGFLSLLFSSKNALGVFPDYEGYGITSSDPHPYLNRELTARQVIAGAKAARDWLENYKRIPMAAKWRGLLVGYSQGGAVAASTIRYYQEYQLDGLNLIGAICGDGPYNPLETMKQYVKDDKLFMPVSAALFLKGFVDTDAEMKALGCTYADFATPAFMDTKIFDVLAKKESTTDDIHSFLLARSKENKGFTMMVYNKKTQSFLAYNAENTARYKDEDWELEEGIGKAYCTADQCFREGLITFFQEEDKQTGEIPAEKLKALKKALTENALTYGDWKPAPGSQNFLLFHSTKDEVVPFVNYQDVLANWGKDCIKCHPYEDPATWTHLDTGKQFVIRVVTFMDEF